MANNGNQVSFKKGEKVSAKKLNELRNSQRITGTFPVIVRSTTGGITISLANITKKGGGPSSKPRIFQIVTNDGGGNYTAQEFDEPYGAEVGDPVTNLYELNGSPNIEADWWVFAYQFGDYIYFDRPLGAC